MNRYLRCSIVVLSFLLPGTPACDYERMSDTESIRPYERRMPDAPVGAVPRDDGEIRARLTPEGSLENPLPAWPDTIARGEERYGRFCVHCHGTRYNGDGTVGQSFSPLPADLRGEALQSMSDDALFRTISYGKDRCPPLASTISIDDRWAIIHWIRSLGVRTPEEEKEPIPSGDFHRSAQGMP